MTEMTGIPDLYQDDEVFKRMRKLQEPIKHSPVTLFDETIDDLLQRLNQAFEFSLLPISEAEQAETIKILRKHNPLLWKIIQEKAQEEQNVASSQQYEYNETNDDLETGDEPLLGDKKSTYSPFNGMDYKLYLKKTIITLDQDRKSIRKKYYDILSYRLWGKPLPIEYQDCEAYVQENYSKVNRNSVIVMLVMLGVGTAFPVTVLLLAK